LVGAIICGAIELFIEFEAMPFICPGGVIMLLGAMLFVPIIEGDMLLVVMPPEAILFIEFPAMLLPPLMLLPPAIVFGAMLFMELVCIICGALVAIMEPDAGAIMGVSSAWIAIGNAKARMVKDILS
jgi:hypothetical protein